MTILFRCDASPQMGLGHLSRCLNLADGLKSKGRECLFAMSPVSEGVHELVTARGHKVVHLSAPEANDTMCIEAVADRSAAAWIVVDHYDIVGQTFARRTQAEWRLCVFDDLGAHHGQDADLLLTPFPLEEAAHLGIAPHINRLAGPRYALVHAAFPRVRRSSLARREKQRRIERVLVCFGGTDSTGASAAAIGALRGQLPEAEVVVIAGPTLSAAMATDPAVRVVHRQSPEQLADLMAWADLAVATTSTIAFELSCVGVPSVLIAVVDNQRLIASALRQLGLAAIGEEVSELPRLIEQLLRDSDDAWFDRRVKWSELCDGRGVERIVNELLERGGGPRRVPRATEVAS